MKNLIETLRKEFTGYGHFSISIRFEAKKLKTTTTNTMAIDAAFDECYDDEDNSGRFYKSRLEAQEALVNEILRANDVPKTDVIKITIILKNRKVTVLSKRLIDLFDTKKSATENILYHTTTILGGESDKKVEVDMIVDRDGVEEKYSLDFSGNMYGTMAVKNGKLMDVIGVTNKTLYTAE